MLSNNCLSRTKDLNAVKVCKNLKESSSEVNKLKHDQLSKYALSMIADVKSYPEADFSVSNSERLGCALEVLQLSSQKHGLYNAKKDHVVTFGTYKKKYGHYITSKGKVVFISLLDKESSYVFGTILFEGHRYKIARNFSNFIIANSEKDFDESLFVRNKGQFKFSKVKLEEVGGNLKANKEYISSIDGFIVANIHNIVKGLIEFREQMAARDISQFDSLGFRQTKGLLRCKEIFSKSQDRIVFNSINGALNDLKNHIYVPDQAKK